MATKMKNVGNLFRQARTRTIIVITAVLILLAVGIGLWKFRSATDAQTRVILAKAPRLESIPGGLNPTEQYAKLQEEQNIQQAAEARKKGTSAIPTIVRTELFSSGKRPIEVKPSEVGTPFSILARQARQGGIPKGLWFDNLKDTNCAKKELGQAIKEGANINLLKEAGCNAKQLLGAGYSLPALKQVGFSAKELRAAGFNAMQLRGAGFDAKQLKKAGFSACDTKSAGFAAAELKQAGYSGGELRGAGFKGDEIKTVSMQQIREAGCNVNALKRLREQGVSAAMIRRVSGCSAKALLDAEYELNAKALREMGYTAKDLLDAGFSVAELKGAGYSARDLRLAGVSAKALQEAGFSAKELIDAGFTDEQVRQAGFTEGELVAAGVTRRKIADAAAPPAAPKTQLQRIMQEQAKHLSEQKIEQRFRRRQSRISAEVNALLAGWRAAPTQSFVAGSPPPKRKEGAQAGAEGTGTAVAGLDSRGRPLQMADIKAGDIYYAVMETAVNSDEPGPILARVIQGKLKGAKLIGSLRLPADGSRVILTFNLMSLKGAPRTMSINAVAIDPNTARTAISSSTDHHYLLRYGSLFAAAFLNGYGAAVETKGTSIKSSNGGASTEISTDPTRGASEFALIGLGRVGKRWGQMAQKNVNRKPTVRVYSGSSLGILFLKDIPVVPGLSKTA